MRRGPKEKRERSLGVHLQLKGERCASPKCAMVRKPHKPGMHGQSRRRKTLSDFGIQIREKQKCKVSYGVDERALRQMFQKAFKKNGPTALNLLQSLEIRLDNVLFRAGFAPSRSMARQLATHGHIFVNQKRVRAPGYQLKAGDVLSVRPESENETHFKNIKESLKKYEAPSWLQVDSDKLTGKVLALPQDINPPFEVNALVESFSK